MVIHRQHHTGNSRSLHEEQPRFRFIRGKTLLLMNAGLAFVILNRYQNLPLGADTSMNQSFHCSELSSRTVNVVCPVGSFSTSASIMNYSCSYWLYLVILQFSYHDTLPIAVAKVIKVLIEPDKILTLPVHCYAQIVSDASNGQGIG
jgi:hypothetical protein